jgi:hypothetical protein
MTGNQARFKLKELIRSIYRINHNPDFDRSAADYATAGIWNAIYPIRDGYFSTNYMQVFDELERQVAEEESRVKT